jgi:hypothetical protein
MDSKPTPGALVLLMEAPAGLLEGLPREDQQAIFETIGKPIQLVGYGDDGRAELSFTDGAGVIRFIYVNPSAIKLAP